MSNLDDLVRGYAFDDRFLGLLTEGFTADDWRYRPPGGGNHAQWILGHLAASRRHAVRLAGGEAETLPWEEHFGAGKPAGDGDHLEVPLLQGAYLDVGDALRDLIVGLSSAQLARELDKPFPNGAHTVQGGLHFLYFHEVYHLGQLGLLRRQRGKPAFV